MLRPLRPKYGLKQAQAFYRPAYFRHWRQHPHIFGIKRPYLFSNMGAKSCLSGAAFANGSMPGPPATMGKTI